MYRPMINQRHALALKSVKTFDVRWQLVAAIALHTPLARCHRPSTIQFQARRVGEQLRWKLHTNNRSHRSSTSAFRVIDWIVLVVGVLLLRARRP